MIKFTLYRSFKRARVLDSLPGVILLKSDRIIDRLVRSSEGGCINFYGEVRVLYDKLNLKPLVLVDIQKQRSFKYRKPYDIAPRLAEGCIRFLSKITFDKFLRKCQESDKVKVACIKGSNIERIIANNTVYDKYLISRSYYIGL